MKRLYPFVAFVLFAPIILSFQNCGQKTASSKYASLDPSLSGSSQGQSGLSNGHSSEGMRINHLYKCEISLQGKNGYQWQVERHYLSDDDCTTALNEAQGNNPNAKILGYSEVFQSFESDVATDRHFVRCDYLLQGSKEFQWRVEKHYINMQDCSGARKEVSLNNPNASIVSEKLITLGYLSSEPLLNYDHKCVFELEGAKGYRWEVERFYNGSDNCQSALNTVRLNNPNAKVLNSEERFIYFSY